MPKAETQKNDTGVLSMISVRATSQLIANCSATNELGTVYVSRKIEACEFYFHIVRFPLRKHIHLDIHNSLMSVNGH